VGKEEEGRIWGENDQRTDPEMEERRKQGKEDTSSQEHKVQE
jgi:hypothetical protein